MLGIPVIDNWWQTETGWPIAANLSGLAPMPTKPGSPSVPVPGYDVQFLGADGQRLPAKEEGAICIELPLPPGTMPTVWGDDDRFVSSYLAAFDGFYLSGDSGYLDEDGYLYVMCAVIGVLDELKGQRPRGFVVLKAGVEQPCHEIETQLIATVRREIGPVAALKDVTIVEGLPKTRSGKILRKTMREIADGREAVIPPRSRTLRCSSDSRSR